MRDLIFRKGIPVDASPEEQRTIIFHRFAVMPSIPTAVLFILVGVHEKLWMLLAASVIGFIMVTCSFLLSVAGRHLPSKVFYNYGCVLAFIVLTLALGDRFSGHAFFLLTGIYAIFVYDKTERRWMLGGLGASALLYCAFAIAAREARLPPWDAITAIPAWIGIGLDIFILVYAIMFALFMTSPMRRPNRTWSRCANSSRSVSSSARVSSCNYVISTSRSRGSSPTSPMSSARP
jgi:hypothetical protein